MITSGKISAAREIMRQKVEGLYTDHCTVYERTDVFDEETKVNKKQTVAVLENQPCRLSFSRLNTNNEADPASKPEQTVKLFISPDVDVRSGSKIKIEHQKRIYEYTRSGIPAVYSTHQEIMLEPFERWA